MAARTRSLKREDVGRSARPVRIEWRSSVIGSDDGGTSVTPGTEVGSDTSGTLTSRPKTDKVRRRPRETKPLPHCRRCGRRLDPKWAFCPYCGAAESEPEADDPASADPPLASGACAAASSARADPFGSIDPRASAHHQDGRERSPHTHRKADREQSPHPSGPRDFEDLDLLRSQRKDAPFRVRRHPVPHGRARENQRIPDALDESGKSPRSSVRGRVADDRLRRIQARA
ncbi:MAG: zinc-ribbon domain-containing protein [Candidatus Eisenbacteria bacterium]|uniref:Zinc-ribbon domain-containing protein n=1 Tax=Eiseniibacteriota bacterium TaxID=2212470 RepID=A0A538UB53_UNCEI|nr:MAG: zinc-ribbon domain-containing protein [Candidatus Eisenbacteria bacterium]